MGLPKFPPENPLQKLSKFLSQSVQAVQEAINEVDAAAKVIDKGMQVEAVQPQVMPPSITDEGTLRYQLDYIIDDLQHLETEHLPNQGRIMGEPCDCIAKAGRTLRRHALETVPIAARQGQDATIYRHVADWANSVMDIGTLDAVNSGKFDEEYLKRAGAASTLRKSFEQLKTQLRPKGFSESCEECGALEDLKSFVKRRKDERE